MNMNVKSKLRISRRTILLTSLLITVLFTTLFVYTLTTDITIPSLDNNGNDDVYSVGTERALKTAINTKQTTPIIITLKRDITLTEALRIPDDKKITLTSNGDEFFKLIGADKCYTLVIENGGVLNIDGLIVTHENGASGNGIRVYPGGTLILSKGKISDNSAARIGGAYDDGGGVYNEGDFKMLGGEISGNNATLFGGGVLNKGTFSMSGGTISKNIAGPWAVRYSGSGGGIAGSGGGVYNIGTFSMSGGTISKNIAGEGGGVRNSDKFNMYGGEISGNAVNFKGYEDLFGDYGDLIYSWIGGDGGGVYNDGTFNRLGGTIFGNTAPRHNDVYSYVIVG